MALYKRNGIWWYEFQFAGKRIRESTKLTNKFAAGNVERDRRNKLERSSVGLTDRPRVLMFSVAAEKYLAAKKPDWRPSSYTIEGINVGHLESYFGSDLLNDITADRVGIYRDRRTASGASPKTISLELGTLRAVLRHHDHDDVWRSIGKKIKLAKAEKIGRCISLNEESALLAECRKSRSRSIGVAVTLSLQACLRLDEIRQLRWRHVDVARRTITVGQSKTDAGQGRVVPISSLLLSTLTVWAAQFPNRKLDHFVFPSEKYGQPKKGEAAKVYAVDVTRPLGTFKYAWNDVRERAGVSCRFHDLRHTAITRLLDSGVSHPVVAEIAGWSTSTPIRMIKEVYGHIGLATRQRAIEQRDKFMTAQALNSPQNSPQFGDQNVTIQ
jgi:integrase